MLKILYIFNEQKDTDYRVSYDILQFLKSKEIEVVVDNEKIAKLYGYKMVAKDELTTLDLVIILGGDGTVLKYLREFERNETPIFGINLGRVGALNVAELSNYQQLLERFLKKDYHVVENLTLDGTLTYKDGTKKSFVIYNEVILHRGLCMKLLPIDMNVDGGIVSKVYADGVLIATPTGSSAYNHSVGGPLLTADTRCFTATPICPQTKGFASVVISENHTLNVEVPDVFDGITVCVDGHDNYLIEDGIKLSVVKSTTKLNFVQFDNGIDLYKVIYKVIDSINR